MKSFSFSITEYQDSIIDIFLDNNFYPSFSEFMRNALEHFLIKHAEEIQAYNKIKRDYLELQKEKLKCIGKTIKN